MADDILAPETTATEDYVETDIFAWANNLVQFKDELKIDLFLINKNYVVYRTSMAETLGKQLEPLFIDEILEAVLEGAGMGMSVPLKKPRPKITSCSARSSVMSTRQRKYSTGLRRRSMRLNCS